MSYLKLLGLAVVAAMAAMAVLGASMASASEPVSESEGGKPVTFTGMGGASTLEVLPEGGKSRTVNCTSTKSSGEFSLASTEKFTKITFNGCTATGPFGTKVSCSSGLMGGEIFTTALKGTLVYLTAGSSEAGIDLEPESGTTIATFTCGFESMTVTGSVIGKFTPVNTWATAYALKFAQTGGKQEAETFLANVGCAPVTDVLSTTGTGAEAFGPRQSGLAAEEKMTFVKQVRMATSKCS
ncbi:MAG TPA: hypothetical protein VF009_06630 [Solirubrobacterales bacterium]